MYFTGKFYQNFKEKVNPVYLHIFQDIKTSKASTRLIP